MIIDCEYSYHRRNHYLAYIDKIIFYAHTMDYARKWKIRLLTFY